jgi:hypothetical protein
LITITLSAIAAAEADRLRYLAFNSR